MTAVRPTISSVCGRIGRSVLVLSTLALLLFPSLPAGLQAQPAPRSPRPGGGLPAAPPQRPGRTASETPLAPPPFLPLDTAWTVATGASPATEPACDNLRLYVPFSTGDVTAFDLATGATVWTRSFATLFAPAVEADRLVLVSDGAVEAWRGSDGAPLWRVATAGTVVAPPLVRSGWVLVALDSGELRALRAGSGEQVWTTALGAIPSSPVVVEGDRFYVGVTGRGLVAGDILSGKHRWRITLDSDITSVAAVAGRVFVATKGRWLYSLEAGDGRERWKWRLGGSAIGLVVDGEQVVALMLDQSMRAFAIGNGRQLWREPLTYRPSAGPILAGPSFLLAGLGPAVRFYARSDGKFGGAYQIPAPAAVATPEPTPAAEPTAAAPPDATDAATVAPPPSGDPPGEAAPQGPPSAPGTAEPAAQPPPAPPPVAAPPPPTPPTPATLATAALASVSLEAIAGAPVVRDVEGVVDDLVVLITQRGTIHAAKRRLQPAPTPITVMPGVVLPVPSAPPPPPAPPGSPN